MKLIGYELKKLFSSKGILLLAVALLVANAALSFFVPSETAPERSDEEYIAGYSDDIRRVIRLAERNLADLSVGGDGFVVDYQRKVIEKYTALAESGQTPAPINGWGEYVSLTGRVTLLLALAVVTGSAVMLCEQDHGMLSFLCISKKGVGAYKAKLWLLLLLSAGSATVFSIADLAVCGIKYGFSGMHAPLVSVRSMELCPYAVSIADYIVIQYAAVTLLAFVAAVLSALIGKLSGSYIFTFLCGGAGCGALYASGFDVNSLFARYRALDLFGRAADALPFYAAALLVSCAFLCAAFCMAGNRRTAWGEWLRRAERMLFGNITSLLEKAAKNKKPRRAKRHGLYVYELKKVFISSKLILLAALLLGAKIYYLVGTERPDDLYEREYYRLCTALGGELTDEKAEYIMSGLAECEDIISRHEEMRELVQSGGITSAGYNEYLQRLYSAEVKKDALTRLNGQKDRIEALRTEGKSAEIVYDTGWLALFCAGPDFFLYALILLLFAGSYSFEVRAGMRGLLPCLKNGGRTLDAVKFSAAVTSAAVLCLIFISADIFFIARTYPPEDIAAPVLSLRGAAPWLDGLSVGGYLMLYILCKTVAHMLFAALVVAAAKLLCRPVLVIPAVTALTILPHFAVAGLPAWLDAANLLAARIGFAG